MPLNENVIQMIKENYQGWVWVVGHSNESMIFKSKLHGQLNASKWSALLTCFQLSPHIVLTVVNELVSINLVIFLAYGKSHPNFSLFWLQGLLSRLITAWRFINENMMVRASEPGKTSNIALYYTKILHCLPKTWSTKRNYETDSQSTSKSVLTILYISQPSSTFHQRIDREYGTSVYAWRLDKHSRLACTDSLKSRWIFKLQKEVVSVVVNIRLGLIPTT